MFQPVGDRYEYERGRILGHGAFAIVFRGREKVSKLPVAIKQINIKNTGGRLSVGKKEIDILKKLKHTNIVQLHEVVEQSNFVFLVMEFCNGGDLGDYLQARKTLSEDSIRHFANHIALGVRALQKLDIIHRDLKPQNLLLSYNPQLKNPPVVEITVKIADFGFARHLSGGDMAATLCGSPLYMAPEVLLGRRYDSSADLWSVGTILYQCLAGEPPFSASNPSTLRKKYHKDELIPKIPEYASQSISHLLNGLLKKLPKERMSFSEFFGHPFLKGELTLPAGTTPPMPHPIPSEAIPIRSSNKASGVRRRSSNLCTDSPRSYTFAPGSADSSSYSSVEPPSFKPVDMVSGSPSSVRMEDVDGFVLVHNSRDYGSSNSSRRGSLSSHASGFITPRSHTSSMSNSPINTPFFPASPKNSERLSVTPPTTVPSPFLTAQTTPKVPFSSLQPRITPPFIPHITAVTNLSSAQISDVSSNDGSPVLSRPVSSRHSSPGRPTIPSPRSPLRRQSSLKHHHQGPLMRNRSEGSQLSDLPHNTSVQPLSLPVITPMGLHTPHRGGLESLLRLDSKQEGILEGERVRSRSDLSHLKPRTTSSSSDHLQRNTSEVSLQSLDSQKEGHSRSDSVSSGSEAFFSILDPLDSGQESDHSSIKSIEEDPLGSLVPTSIPFESLTIKESPLQSPDTNLTFPFSPHVSGDSLLTPIAKNVTCPVPWATPTARTEPPIVENVGLSESTATIQGEDDVEMSECLQLIQHGLVVGEELLSMAHDLVSKEPLLHVSHDVFSLSCSTSLDDPIRYQEQLVLLTKAVQILKTCLRAVSLEDASLPDGVNMAPDIKTNEEKVKHLLHKVREEALAVRERVRETKDMAKQKCVTPAEKMMYLRAMRMCEETALEEQFGTRPSECLKRYKTARCLLQQLHREAQSGHDKTVLDRYVRFLDFRLATVSKLLISS